MKSAMMVIIFLKVMVVIKKARLENDHILSAYSHDLHGRHEAGGDFRSRRMTSIYETATSTYVFEADKQFK